jgi:hypothetical protein
MTRYTVAVLVAGLFLPSPQDEAKKDAKKDAEMKWAKEVATDFLRAGLNRDYSTAETLVTADFKRALKEANLTVGDRLRAVVNDGAESWVVTSEEMAPDQDEAVVRGTFKGKNGEAEFSVRVTKEKEGGKWRVCFFTAGEPQKPKK